MLYITALLWSVQLSVSPIVIAFNLWLSICYKTAAPQHAPVIQSHTEGDLSKLAQSEIVHSDQSVAAFIYQKMSARIWLASFIILGVLKGLSNVNRKCGIAQWAGAWMPFSWRNTPGKNDTLLTVLQELRGRGMTQGIRCPVSGSSPSVLSGMFNL